MQSEVLLRGFAPDIPENQMVIFCEGLPAKATCTQCDNVSAVLHRDPEAHGYCSSCMKMNFTEDSFYCSECNLKYHVSQLIVDRSIRDKIKAMKIICPKSAQGKQVQITFNALKAHLQRCSCDQISDPPADLEQPASLSFSSMKMASCPRCNEVVPKKLILTHVKGCRSVRKRQSTQLQQVPVTEMIMAEEEKKTAVNFADSISVDQQLRDAQYEISDLKGELAKLKEELSRKNEILSAMKEEEQNRHQVAQLAISNLTERIASTLDEFQEECDRLRGGIDQMSSDISQVTLGFQRELRNLVNSFFPSGEQESLNPENQ